MQYQYIKYSTIALNLLQVFFNSTKVINFNLRKTSFALESASAPGRDDGDSSEINVV